MIYLLSRLFPAWRGLSIYEAGPGGAASAKLSRECSSYVSSQFFPDTELGTLKRGVRAENLECLTLSDESFDLVVTQDVLEHVLRPQLVVAEIARVLRPGGSHVFTVPCYRGRTSVVRAVPGANDSILHLLPPDYHGDPIDPNGTLVVTEWGDDLFGFIEKHSGMPTTAYPVRNRGLGLDGKFLEVFVSRKPTSDPTTARETEGAAG